MNEINVLFEQASVLEEQGDYAAAEPIFMQALALKEASASSEELVADYYNAGVLFFVQEKYSQAEEYLARSLQLEEKAIGADSPEILSTLEHLAEAHFNQGAFDKAEKLYHRFLDLHARSYGEQGAEIFNHLQNLAEICELQGRQEAADEYRARAQKLMSEELCEALSKKAS